MIIYQVTYFSLSFVTPMAILKMPYRPFLCPSHHPSEPDEVLSLAPLRLISRRPPLPASFTAIRYLYALDSTAIAASLILPAIGAPINGACCRPLFRLTPSLFFAAHALSMLRQRAPPFTTRLRMLRAATHGTVYVCYGSDYTPPPPYMPSLRNNIHSSFHSFNDIFDILLPACLPDVVA